jgi:cytochrome P450
MTAGTVPGPFDPNALELRANPYPTYAAYRSTEPVHLGTSAEPGSRGTWYLFAFDDSERVLVDTDTYRSDPGAMGREAVPAPPGWEAVGHVFRRFLGGIDPPDHDRLRALLRKAFSPREIEKLRSRIQDVADSLFAETFDLPGRCFDLVADFAFPFPMIVVGEILGVSADRRAQFKKASAAIADAIDNPADRDLAAAGSSAIAGLLEYFAELLKERRRHPRQDVLTGMVEAARQDESILSEEQLLAIAVELLVAGHETTVNAISLSIFGLGEDEAAARALASADPTTLPACIEELLRWTSPSQRQRPRWPARDVEIGGRAIRRGEPVVVVTGAANRDPDRFPSPDRMVFDRPKGSRHIAFGRGPHFCLGANLARLELGIAMPRIAAALTRIDIPGRGDVRWRPNTLLPGPVAVPVQTASS